MCEISGIRKEEESQDLQDWLPLVWELDSVHTIWLGSNQVPGAQSILTHTSPFMHTSKLSLSFVALRFPGGQTLLLGVGVAWSLLSMAANENSPFSRLCMVRVVALIMKLCWVNLAKEELNPKLEGHVPLYIRILGQWVPIRWAKIKVNQCWFSNRYALLSKMWGSNSLNIF